MRESEKEGREKKKEREQKRKKVIPIGPGNKQSANCLVKAIVESSKN